MPTQYIINSLEAYVNSRIPTGGFLHAVLSNDLQRACMKADDINKHLLFEIVSYIYNNLPMGCYGSPEKVEKWLTGKENE